MTIREITDPVRLSCLPKTSLPPQSGAIPE